MQQVQESNNYFNKQNSGLMNELKPSPQIVSRALLNVFPNFQKNQMDDILLMSKDLNSFIEKVVSNIPVPNNHYELHNALHRMRNIADEQEKTIQKNMVKVNSKEYLNNENDNLEAETHQTNTVLSNSNNSVHIQQSQQQQIQSSSVQQQQNTYKKQQPLTEKFSKYSSNQKQTYEPKGGMINEDIIANIKLENNPGDGFMNIENNDFFRDDKIESYVNSHQHNNTNNYFDEEYQFKQFFKNEGFADENNFLNHSNDDNNLSAYFK